MMRVLRYALLPWLASLFLALAADPAPAPATDCLLISGQVRAGRITLDPAFQLRIPPAPPEPGDCRLELLDAEGGPLLQVAFATYAVADAPAPAQRGFAFALPLPQAAAGYRGLRIQGPDGAQLSRFAGLKEAPADLSACALDGELVRIRWNASAYPAALIRDPATQAILARAEGGCLDLATRARCLEVHLSDGVRSRGFSLQAAAYVAASSSSIRANTFWLTTVR